MLFRATVHTHSAIFTANRFALDMISMYFYVQYTLQVQLFSKNLGGKMELNMAEKPCKMSQISMMNLSLENHLEQTEGKEKSMTEKLDLNTDQGILVD